MSTRTALWCSAALVLASAAPRWLAAPNTPIQPVASAKPGVASQQQLDGTDDCYELHASREPQLLLRSESRIVARCCTVISDSRRAR